MRCGITVPALVVGALLSVPGSAVERSSDPAREIIRELERLQASTEAGVSYRDFSSRVADANRNVFMHMDAAGPTLSAGFRDHASSAMCYYTESARGWNARIVGKPDKVLLDSCVRHCEGPSIRAALNKEKAGEVFDYTTVGFVLLQDLWNCAKSETATAATSGVASGAGVSASTSAPSAKPDTRRLEARSLAPPSSMQDNDPTRNYDTCIRVSATPAVSRAEIDVTLRNGCKEALNVFLSVDRGAGQWYELCSAIRAGADYICSVPVSATLGDVKACPLRDAGFDPNKGECDPARAR